MAKVPNAVENFNRLSRAHERYRRHTDGRAISDSEREHEFTFANNSEYVCIWLAIISLTRYAYLMWLTYCRIIILLWKIEWKCRFNIDINAMYVILLWPPCVADADIVFSSCGFFYLLSSFFFSSPNLSRRRLDVYHTCTHGVALVRI